MLAVMRQRGFALLWLANLINVAGDWVLLFAFPFAIYEMTGSALASGAMFMAATLPRLVLGSVAGVFVDRWDRRRTAVVADLARVAVLLPLLAVRSPDWLWLVYLVGILESILAQFAMPAKTALLPALVSEERLPAANALLSLNHEINRLMGPLLGALLLTWTGLTGVVLVDSVTFLVSGLLIAAIGLPLRAVNSAPAEPGAGLPPWGLVWREWRAGLAVVRGHRWIASVFVIIGVAMISEGIFNVVFVPFVKDVLGGGPIELGWLMSAQAVGGLAGGLAIGRLGHRLSPGRVVPASAAVFGLTVMLAASGPPLEVVLPLIALAGLAVMGSFITLFALLQRLAEDAYRGRVFGAFLTVNALMSLVGMGLAGLLTDRVGVAVTLGLGGAIQLAVAVLAARLLHGLAAPGQTPLAARPPEPANA
jgi:MFS family permease